MNDLTRDEPTGGFQVLVSLKNVAPTIWRRIVVPRDISLELFHSVVQVAMGWDDYHLHLFKKKDSVYLIPDEEEGLKQNEHDESGFQLKDLFIQEGDVIEYLYDFGDNWEHEIKLEEILEESPGDALCLDGKRACPPEDVGGASGYLEFLAAMKDVHHPKHQEYIGWLGDEFDPEEFDIELTNEMLEEFGE